MHEMIKKINSSVEILDKAPQSNDGELYFSLHTDDVLLVFSKQHEGPADGVYLIGSPATLLKSIESALSEYKTANNDIKSDHLEAKIIASASLEGEIKNIFLKPNINISKYISITQPTEVLFLKRERKIRFAPKKSLPTKSESPISVMVVDDSKTIRDLLHRILKSDTRIGAIHLAEKPSDALALYKQHKPDVITLDIHMPEMNGIELLKELKKLNAVRAVMISSVSLTEGTLVLDALEQGAIDYIQKPSLESGQNLAELGKMIVDKIVTAARAKLANTGSQKNLQSKSTLTARPTHLNSAAKLPTYQSSAATNIGRIVAIGSSTGGTEALKHVFTSLPNEIPPIVVVQHIPPIFSAAFAERINQMCAFEVKEAADGDLLKPNRVLIAAGGTQLGIVKRGNDLICKVTDAPPVNRHKPSVDYLFDSIAQLNLGSQLIAGILTGMGADGARGLKKLRDQHARTFAQNEETCVVFGMPREAIQLGAAEFIEPLDYIAGRIMTLLTTETLTTEQRPKTALRA